MAKKNPHAVALGKLGGRKRMQSLSRAELLDFARSGGKAGGKARAAKLTKEQRSAIARKAAAARWGKPANK
jgi:hypothetical protein